MILLITGDRNWSDASVMTRVFDVFKPSVLIEGGARGADAMAKSEALRRGIEVRTFEANWDAHGRAAGPIRNALMLDQCPDAVVAVHAALRESRGTRDCVLKSLERGFPTYLAKADGGECSIKMLSRRDYALLKGR